MSYLIKEIPLTERPRERFKKYGAKALSNEELLSILLRTGTTNKSVNLKNIKGIGEVKAITLLSAIEFGKRVLSKEDLVTKIKDSKDAYYLVKDELENELQEKFLSIYLDTKNKVIIKKVIFIGTVNNSSVTARDVFREGVKCNASKMIIVHNHPAGSIEPSFADLTLTNEFIKIGKIIGITVIDHLIIGKNNYYSFRESAGDLFVT